VLTETQTAILPLVTYLDTLRWVFIAVALGGIAAVMRTVSGKHCTTMGYAPASPVETA